jgi:hypothetical protein
MYQNGDMLYAGTNGNGTATGIICLEKAGNEDNTYYLKGNDGHYVQDRSGLGKSDTYQFSERPVLYSIKQKPEYEGQYYFEQHDIVPANYDFTDAQRCLICNGDNAGVSTWGPNTAQAHWVMEPLAGHDTYTLVLIGVETVTYVAEGYTGSTTLHNGGFIAVPADTEIATGDIISAIGKKISVSIDQTGKTITVTPAATEMPPYYRIRSAASGHTSHYMYQNGDMLYAGTNGTESVTGIFHFEKADNAAGACYLKANNGRYIQDRSKLSSTNDIYRFGESPVTYVLKSAEYSYPEGVYCLEQVEYTPGKTGFTDVQRCLKCNGNNAGVSTWGPWTEASRWMLEPLYGYSIYTLELNGIEAVTYGANGYTGSAALYNGGFIAVPAKTEIIAEDIASTEGEAIEIDIDKEAGIIRVKNSDETGIQVPTLSTTNNEVVVYDIAGRRVKKMEKGIYIMNGKKVVTK